MGAMQLLKGEMATASCLVAQGRGEHDLALDRFNSLFEGS